MANPLSTPNLLDMISEQNMFLSCDLRPRTDAHTALNAPFCRLDFWQPKTDSNLQPGDLEIFSCNRCSFKTTGNSDLLNHFYAIHKPKKQVEIFPRTRSASLSQSSETIQVQDDFQCPQCPLVCQSTASLKNHITRSHGKKFKCKECSYSCGTKATMTKHLKIH